MQRLSLTLALLCAAPAVDAQNAASALRTAGYGEVATVEAKARQIAAGRAALEREKTDILAVHPRWAERLRGIEAEIAELERQRDSHIHDLKFGLKCSECNRTKTELEKLGINFEEHLRTVKGRALPAPATELEGLRRSYSEKLAVKRVALQRARAQELAEVTQKRDVVQRRETEIARLCAEMAAHGRAHEAKVLVEAKFDQKGWARDLVTHVTVILIARDKVAIQKAREIDVEAAFRADAQNARDRLQREVDAAVDQNRITVEGIRAEVEAARAARDQRIIELETEGHAIQRRIGEIRSELARLAPDAVARPALDAELARLNGQANAVVTARSDAQSRYVTAEMAATAEVRRRDALIVQIRAALPEAQAKAVAELRQTADRRRAEARTAGAAAAEAATAGESVLRARELHYQRLLVAYSNGALEESQRMLLACRPIGCPIASDASGQAVLNWSKLRPCATGHTMAKPHNSNVFNAYCVGELSTVDMLGNYRMFLSGLTANDLAAVKAGSNAAWFSEVAGRR